MIVFFILDLTGIYRPCNMNEYSFILMGFGLRRQEV